MKRVVVLGCIVLSIASLASGQTVGWLKPITDNTILSSPTVLTGVNYSHPATAAGPVSTATVSWAGGPCTGAFKLKFFRRTGETYNLTAERGPFATVFGLATVTLSPPVTLAKGDFIGVVQLRSDCGGAMITKIDPNLPSLVTAAGDVSSFTLATATLQTGFELNVRASADGSVREGVIPVAGSAAGAFGSNFRTSVSLANGRRDTITGRLVFHPTGRAGLPSDPSVPYTLDNSTAVSFNDIVAALGATGLGSVDLITTSSYRPIVTARVFDDRGATGTSGFTEELFDPSEALLPSETDSFSIPVDTTNFRMNLGVRTLDLPTTVRFTLVSAAGGTASPVERTYLQNSFEQIGATVVLGPLFAGGAIRARIIEGSAFVYASTTDNRTNDSSAQFSRRE
jgi:hypothetical protein